MLSADSQLYKKKKKGNMKHETDVSEAFRKIREKAE